MLVSSLTSVLSVAAVNDTTPPVVQSLSVSPSSVVAGNSVTVTARITDDLSGVDQVVVFYNLPGGNYNGPNGNFQFVSGTKNDGIWQATINIPSAFRSGTYTVNDLLAIDAANNRVDLRPPTPPTADATFTVIDSTTQNPAPTLSSVSPASGPTSGGTPVTITGTNFAPGASVAVGGLQATNVRVVNSTTIIAIAPAHGTGSVAVNVANANQQAGTYAASLPNAFRYVDVIPLLHSPGGTMSGTTPQPQPGLHPVSPPQGTPATGPGLHALGTVTPTSPPTPMSQPMRH